jgi:hypothetical protein
LDFSVNTNPLGPAPSVLQAVRGTDWSRYPGDDEEPLRRRLAERAGVAPEQVVLGNGSAELTWLVALAALRAGDRVGIVGPTFGEYARAVRVVGATPVSVRDPREASSVRALSVCNPNNPSGHYRVPEEIEHLLEEQPGRLLVLDEAYAPFVDNCWRSETLLEFGNLVILRSMTKDQALPGLRLGYLLAVREVATAVEAVRPPWNVNAGALRAGLAALVQAARWLGQFHAATESRTSGADVSFLNSYDAPYYLGWSRRTLRFASELRSEFPWLETLCGRFEESVDVLLTAAPTIIHGEFYPHNILLSDGQIYPIDWESAAVAAGEIDVATLTEAWKPEHLRQCEVAYRKARWGGTAPAGFARTLAAARLYVCFRWLGEQPEWTLHTGNREYFDQMRVSGEELGLI